MAQVLLIGLGAGAASALLFASIVSGSPLAILLFYLAALPLVLAAIAWSHMAGMVAVAFGALSLAAALNYWKPCPRPARPHRRWNGTRSAGSCCGPH
jgi:hypothetical protein